MMRETSHPRSRYAYSKGKTCIDCGTPVTGNSKGRCAKCSGIARRGTPSKTGRFTNVNGYVVLSGKHDHPNSWKHNGCILEHTYVMSQMLGRPLLKEENVHHKNGVRDDNRPENLELWSSSQPAGQRVEDKLRWAHEIIKLYGVGETHQDSNNGYRDGSQHSSPLAAVGQRQHRTEPACAAPGNDVRGVEVAG